MKKSTKRIAVVILGLTTAVSSSLVVTNSYADRVIVIDKPQHHHRVDPVQKGKVVVAPRNRHFRGVRVVRPHGRPFHGYGHFYTDHDAFKYLAFTAITLKVLDNLNEEQQRLHEAAQVRATEADVGETIVWNEGGATGSVTTTKTGTSTSGRQCREFQQTVTIGGKEEQTYGTACLQSDGSWEVMQ